MTRVDKLVQVLTGLTVAGLAIVAGAISFAHMTDLAQHHDQGGWKAFAFPISVDGLEIVASLYLVAQRRAGRPTGWVPWVALIVGTAASLAANVAVGGGDPIGRALAGWPALSMLIAVKLLFSMLDHVADDHPAVRADQRPSADRPAVPGTAPGPGLSETPPSGTVPGRRGTDGRSAVLEAPNTNVAQHALPAPGHRTAPIDVDAVADLIPAAMAARTALAAEGRSLSRDNLADQMRDDGHGVSNARASLLLKIVRTGNRGPQGLDAAAPSVTTVG